MPITTTEKIWMDGELVDWTDATVHVLTHTLHYGLGVFEGEVEAVIEEADPIGVRRGRQLPEDIDAGARFLALLAGQRLKGRP